MKMKRNDILLTALLISSLAGYAQNGVPPTIEVTGTATLNIVPDRISIEIGMEEYYKHKPLGDSVVVKLADIENNVRKTFRDAGVSDSLIVVSDMGNYRDRGVSATLLMAKRLSATVSDFSQIEYISEKLDRKGISTFNIVNAENSEMTQFNRQGLESALDAARTKAEYIAEKEGLEITAPYEITETTNEPSGYSLFSNVSYDGGAGMDNLRRIVRRYSVKVRYLFTIKK